MEMLTYTPLNFSLHVSGPAWPNKILFYLKEIAEGRMNGWDQRTDQSNKYGNSWCLNFMIGLQLIKKGETFNDRVVVNGQEEEYTCWKALLTPEGEKIYNTYNDVQVIKDEGKDFGKILDQSIYFENKSPSLIPTFKQHCAKTEIFKYLYELLENIGYVQSKSDFKEKYAQYVIKLYSDDTTQVSSSMNRVPSIIQLCEFLGVCLETPTSYWFDKDEFKKMFDDSMTFQLNDDSLDFKSKNKIDGIRNRIVFGAPGTGKSHKVNMDKDKLLENGGRYERVTFHPDYTYAQFVGTYKPKSYNLTNGEKKISYEYSPGPFIRILIDALKNAQSDLTKPFLLLIEEINRADVAAVFGDVFQLLDRDKNGVSQYPIQTSEDLRAYLADKLNVSESKVTQIRIPDNMFIWATMNSADQGVFPMDTAFKRRWNFEYIDIDQGEEKIQNKSFKVDNGVEINWNCLRKAINDTLSNNRINEDKLMGAFFIAKDVIDDTGENANEIFVDVFCNKVIMYLFEDAARQRQDKIFLKEENTVLRYSKLCLKFRKEGLAIFTEAVNTAYKQYKKEYDDKINANDTQVQE